MFPHDARVHGFLRFRSRNCLTRRMSSCETNCKKPANLGYPWFLDTFAVFKNFLAPVAFQDPWFLVEVSCGTTCTVPLEGSWSAGDTPTRQERKILDLQAGFFTEPHGRLELAILTPLLFGTYVAPDSCTLLVGWCTLLVRATLKQSLGSNLYEGDP